MTGLANRFQLRKTKTERRLDYPDKKSEALLAKRKDRHRAAPEDESSDQELYHDDEEYVPTDEEEDDEEKQAEVPKKKPKAKPKPQKKKPKKPKKEPEDFKKPPHFKSHKDAKRYVIALTNRIKQNKINKKVREYLRKLIEFYEWHEEYGVKSLITWEQEQTLQQLKQIREQIG